MGIKEGLLTLLAQSQAHGYQLKLDFEAATGEAWPLNIGQVYTTLQRLERDELVEIVETDDEGRVIYAITLAGRQELGEWMLSPVERTVANRDDVSMKLLLAMASHVVDPVRVIAIQRDATMAAIQDYTRLKASTSSDDLAWLLHIDRLILRAEAELRWLDRVEDRLGHSQPQRHARQPLENTIRPHWSAAPDTASSPSSRLRLEAMSAVPPATAPGRQPHWESPS